MAYGALTSNFDILSFKFSISLLCAYDFPIRVRLAWIFSLWFFCLVQYFGACLVFGWFIVTILVFDNEHGQCTFDTVSYFCKEYVSLIILFVIMEAIATSLVRYVRCNVKFCQ